MGKRRHSRRIASVQQFVEQVLRDCAEWKRDRTFGRAKSLPWFRGEIICRRPLLPKLYRSKTPYRENQLLQGFRRMAVLPGAGAGLDRKLTDSWLYIARHAGLPTRLLDWTEGALIALFFAAREEKSSAVWMLHPIALNDLSSLKGFDLPWHPPHVSAGNIRAAWQEDNDAAQKEFPVAIYPAHVHPRLQVQRSCFTVHGKRKEGLRDLMREAARTSYLKEYRLYSRRHSEILSELRVLGISHASLFPDLDGLATDLTMQYWREEDV